MRMQQAIQHQDPPNIPIKNAQNDQQCPLVRLQPNLAQRLRNPVRNGSDWNQHQQIQKSQHCAQQSTDQNPLQPLSRQTTQTVMAGRQPNSKHQ